MKTSIILVSVFLLTAAPFCIAQKKQTPKHMTVVFGHSTWGTGTYYKISPDGTVASFSTSNLPPSNVSFTRLRPLSGKGKSELNPPKPPKLKERIASRDLKVIRTRIQEAGLIKVPSGLIGKNEGCPDGNITTDTSGDQISIKMDGVTKHFSSYCQGSAGTTADLYEKLYKHLYDLLKNVRVKAITEEEFYKDLR